MVLSQIGCLWNDSTSCDAASSVTRRVGEATGNPHGTGSGACQPRAGRDLQIEADECEEELEFLERFKGINMMPFLLTDRLLGSLAHCAGQTRRALVHFENALAFCRKSGYRPELAWTLDDYAKALLDTGSRR